MKDLPPQRPTPATPLTLDMIRAKWASMLAKGESVGTATHHACYFALEHFLGLPWLKKHVLSECSTPGYLSHRPKMVDEFIGIDKDHTQRVVQLAEALLNLQAVEGLGDRLDRLYQGQIEPTMAELDFGMFMRVQGTDFRYVEASGVKTRDYDVELFYPDGIAACGDIKCKLDGSAFSKTGLLSTLTKGRQQLPADRPGILFVKVPQEWVDRSTGILGAEEDAAEALEEFFRSTQRVVLVAFYSKMTTELAGGTAISYMCRQFENKSVRFDRDGSWGLFDVDQQKPVWLNLSAALRM